MKQLMLGDDSYKTFLLSNNSTTFCGQESGFKNWIRLVSVDAKTCPDQFFASIKIYNFFFAHEKNLFSK